MPLELPERHRQRIFPTRTIERDVKLVHGGFWQKDAPEIEIGVLKQWPEKAPGRLLTLWYKLKEWVENIVEAYRKTDSG